MHDRLPTVLATCRQETVNPEIPAEHGSIEPSGCIAKGDNSDFQFDSSQTPGLEHIGCMPHACFADRDTGRRIAQGFAFE